MKHLIDHKYGRAPQHVLRYKIVKSDVAVLIVPGGGWVGTSIAPANFNNGEDVRTIAEQYGISVGICTYTTAREGFPTAQITRDNPRRNRPTHNVMTAAKMLKELSGAKYLTLVASSAGGQIAATTYSFYPDVIDRLVCFYGAFDLTKPEEFSKSVQAMIRTYTGNQWNKKVGSSPVFDKKFPEKKYLLFHGDRDPVVHAIQSARMLKFHPQGELVVVPGKGHGAKFKPFGTEDNPPPYMARLIKFFHTGD